MRFYCKSIDINFPSFVELQQQPLDCHHVCRSVDTKSFTFNNIIFAVEHQTIRTCIGVRFYNRLHNISVACLTHNHAYTLLTAIQYKSFHYSTVHRRPPMLFLICIQTACSVVSTETPMLQTARHKLSGGPYLIIIIYYYLHSGTLSTTLTRSRLDIT